MAAFAFPQEIEGSVSVPAAAQKNWMVKLPAQF
jgi:hypothetical protein